MHKNVFKKLYLTFLGVGLHVRLPSVTACAGVLLLDDRKRIHFLCETFEFLHKIPVFCHVLYGFIP